MRTYVIAYLATVVVFFGMDFVWLSILHGSLYKARLGSLLLDKPDLVIAGLFYVLYVVGIVVFAVLPAIQHESWVRALWGGALFGLVAYASYDMTNLATLKNWSAVVTFVDMAWGTAATGTAATVGYFIARALK